jgi:hypothetical protein
MPRPRRAPANGFRVYLRYSGETCYEMRVLQDSLQAVRSGETKALLPHRQRAFEARRESPLKALKADFRELAARTELKKEISRTLQELGLFGRGLASAVPSDW